MARIRSIHPGLFTDEEFMRLTVEAALAVPLLIGLLTEADDDGIFEWKPMTLKARLLPAANVDVSDLLAILVERRFIMEYSLGGKQYGAIRNFKRYQRPKKPNPIHPSTPDVLAYVGTGSEPVPHQFGTDGENPPQMEDGGGRGRKKEDAHASSAREIEKPEEDPLKAKCVSLRKRVAGLYADFGTNPNNPVPDTGMCDVWVRQGYDPEIIFAIIEGNVRRGKGGSTLNYHERQIREAHEKRAPAPPPTTEPIAYSPEIWDAMVARFRRTGAWNDRVGPDPSRTNCPAPSDILEKHGYRSAA